MALASQEFDVFLTIDRNRAFQQNVNGLAIAVIVFHAPTNRLADLRPLMPQLLIAVESAKPGLVTIRVGP